MRSYFRVDFFLHWQFQVEHTEYHETQVQARQAEITIRERENEQLQLKNDLLIEQLVRREKILQLRKTISLPDLKVYGEKQIEEFKEKNRSLQKQIDELNQNLKKQLIEAHEQLEKQIDDYAQQSVGMFKKCKIVSDMDLFVAGWIW